MIYDAVIAGYGPTGLALASLLSKRGHRVCVFERWPTLYGQPRMATIDGESARIIQAACDVDHAFRNSIARTQFRFANEQGEILIDHGWSGEHVCGFSFRISLHQPDIEDAMDAAARAQGVEVNQGWEVVALEQVADHVSVTACERTTGESVCGAQRSVEARWVIGADGARSRVRELLGIEREAWPYRNAWYSVDATRKGPLPDFWGTSPDGQVAVIFCLPAGRAHSVIPLGTRHIRFNFEVDPDSDHTDKLDTAAAYRWLRSIYGIGADEVEVYRQAVYPFEGKLARAWRVGRVFLAGDAAHLMTPFLGQGGCAALRDAINLAWKLDLVLEGNAGEALLDTYEQERKPHVRVHIEGSDRLAALAFIRDPEAAAARDRRYSSEGAPAPPPEPIVETGVLARYRDGQRLVGGLGPQGSVRRNGKTGRFDDVAGWGFQLIAWNLDPASVLVQAQRELLARIGAIAAGIARDESTSIYADVNGTYQRFFEAHGLVGILVRPDFVVF